MSAVAGPDRTLSATQAAAWTAELKRLMENARIKTRTELMKKAFGNDDDKASMSRFFNGDKETLMRWLDRLPEKYALPLANALGTSVDALHALFDVARAGDGQGISEIWHPSFPGVRLADVEIECVFDPPLDKLVGKQPVVLAGVRGDGLDIARAQLARRFDSVDLRERRACDWAPRLGNVRALHLQQWGVAQVRALIDKLVGRGPVVAGVRKDGVPLVRAEEAQHLIALAAHLDAEPLLPPIRRAREIIEWLGRVSRGEPIRGVQHWYALAADSERARWRAGDESHPLHWLDDEVILAVVRGGWACEASSRAQWQVVAAEVVPSPVSPGALADLVKRLQGKPSKSDLETLARVVANRDQPSALVDALLAGDVLIAAREGSVALAYSEATHALVGRWMARRRDGARWWVQHAHRAGSFEVLRAAASFGLPWDRLATALEKATALNPIDRCRAVIAFAAYAPDAEGIAVDDTFVRRWAGAMCAAMFGVFERATMDQNRWSQLVAPFATPTLLPAETDLRIVARRMGLRLPLFMPEQFDQALLKHIDDDVLAIVKAWRAALPPFWGAYNPDSADMYALFRVLAPTCAWPDMFSWEDERAWSHIEVRARQDESVQGQLATWPLFVRSHSPPESVDTAEAYRPERRADHVAISPPDGVLFRWACKGDRSQASLARWARLFCEQRWSEGSVPGHEALFGQVEAALRHFGEDEIGVVEGELRKAVSQDYGNMLGGVLRQVGGSRREVLLRLAERLGCRALLGEISTEARSPFSRPMFNQRFLWLSTRQCGIVSACGRLKAEMAEVIAWGLSAAEALARMGEADAVRAWATWSLRGPEFVDILEIHIMLDALAQVPIGLNRPPEEDCEAQIAAWFDGEQCLFKADHLAMMYLKDWMPFIEAARQMKSVGPLQGAILLWDRAGMQRRTGDSQRSETEYSPLRHGPGLGGCHSWAVAIVQTVFAVVGRQRWLPLIPEMWAWAKATDPTWSGQWCDSTEKSVRWRAERALMPAPVDAPEIPRRPVREATEPVLTAEELRLQAYSSLIYQSAPDSEETRATCSGFADAARVWQPASERLAETLYWTVRAGNDVDQAVVACLDAPDFHEWLDEFHLVKNDGAPFVMGGRLTGLALAVEHASLTQVRRLVTEFPIAEAYLPLREWDTRPIANPGKVPHRAGRCVDILRHMAQARMSTEALLQLPIERVYVLGLTAWRCEHISLADARTRLEALLVLGRGARNQWDYHLPMEAELLLQRICAADDEPVSTCERWLIEYGPLHFSAKMLLDHVFPAAPERATEVYRQWLCKADAEEVECAVRWLASDAPILPGGGSLLRARIAAV